MKGRLSASEDSRGVTDIVGVVILISMAIVGALLVAAVGGMALSDINAQTNDDLAHDSFREVDSRLSDLSETSVDSTTSFTFSDGVGSDVTARPNNGSVNISVKTKGSVSMVKDGDGVCSINSTLGTIQYENRDDTLMAYQGGGLWRQTTGETQVESNPGLDYDGTSIDLSFVNISTLGSISEGNEVKASKNVSGSQLRTEYIQQRLSPCWTVDNASGTVPVEIEITIESRFADGWAKYAMNDMQQPLDPADVTTAGTPLTTATLEDVRDNESVTLHLGTIGDTSGVATTPSDFPHKVIYSGLSQYAKFNSEIYPTGDSPNEVVVDRAENSPGYTFAIYHPKYDSWFHHHKSGEWRQVNGSSKNDTLPWVSTSVVGGVPSGMNNATSSNIAYDLDKNASVCVAESLGEIASGKCDVNMTGIASDNPAAPYDEEPHYVVDILSTNTPVRETESLSVDVNVTNTGGADGEKHVFLGDFNGTLVGWNKNVEVDKGNSTTITLEWPTTIGDADSGNITVEAEGGDSDSWDTAPATIKSSDANASQFDVSIDSTNEPVDGGQMLSVGVTVQNTGNESDTQWVVLEDFDGHAVDVRNINLTAGQSNSTTLNWQTRAGDGGTGDVTVRTLDDNNATEVTVNGTSSSGGILYVGPIGSSDAEDYLTTGNITVDTAYQRVDVTSGSACTGFSKEKYGDSGTDVVCEETADPPHSGYVLDMHYSNDDYEDYDLYVADVNNGTWEEADATSASDDDAMLVHSEDVDEIDSTSHHGDVGTFHEVANDNPVCIVEEGTSVDPDQDCGPILNVSGSMDYNSNNYLEVNATEANLSVLTAQVGHARERNYTVRLPIDVFFVLDESGSMAEWYSIDSKDLSQGTYTVPNDRRWVEQGWGGETYYPGETFNVSSTWGMDVDVMAPPSDPSGKRIDATRSFVGNLNNTLDRAGTTQFNWNAYTQHPLTHDFEDVNSSIAPYGNGGTDIHAGIDDGADGLTAPGDSNKRIMVVLSDGKPSPGAEDPVKAAEDAADHNITIYTVGLGGEVNKSLMKDIAHETNGSYYHADNASELVGKFDEIVTDAKENRAIQRGQTTVTALNGNQTLVQLDNSSHLNDPNYFNTSGSQTIGTQLSSGLDNSDLSFEMSVAPCGNYTATNVTSTLTLSNGTTHDYVQMTCTNPDLANAEKIDNSSINNHVIVTEGNSKTLADIDKSKWWQPDPEDLSAMDPYTDASGNVDLNDTEAIIGLEVDAENQSGYVLLHFEVNQTEEVRDDWEGDNTTEYPELAVNATGTNSPVTEGDTMTVDANITNVGDTNGTQYVVLRAGGYVVDSTGVTLGPGDSRDVTLSWETAPGDASVSSVTVVTRDHADPISVNVSAKNSPEFKITSDPTADDPVTEGDILTVEATIKNIGAANGTQYVTLRDSADNVLAADSLTLNQSQSETATLSWAVPLDTTNGSEIEKTLTVETIHYDRDVEPTIKPATDSGTGGVSGDIAIDPIEVDVTKIEIES